ncbi:MAG: adenylate kinase [Bacillota bacterium]
MRIVFLGPPGAGKGTQAELMSRKFSIPRIAPGDLFRKAVAENSDLGRTVKEYLDAGRLVPDEITVGLIRARITGDSARAGFILDGFPRNLVQARALEQMLTELGLSLDAAVYITVPVERLVERSAGRMVCSKCGAAYHVRFNPPRVERVCDACGGELYQRDDDRPETVTQRLQVYERDTAPLVEYYRQRGLLKEIDGDQPVEKVFQDIQEALGLA